MSHTTAFPVRRDADCMAAIGRSLFDLRGIRFDEGEGGNAPAADDAAAAAAAAAEAASASASEVNPATGKAYTAEETAARITALNNEAKTHRLAAAAAIAAQQEAERKTAGVLAALGLTPDGAAKPKTAEELQASIDQHVSAAEQTARENLVLRVAARPGINANADKLLDSRAFITELSALDKADAASVEALVKAAIQKDATLVNAPPAARGSGGSHHTGGGNNEGRPGRQASFDNHYKQK